MSQSILDKNIFMFCNSVSENAFRSLPEGYILRNCHRNELDIWKRIHFDSEREIKENIDYMHYYYDSVYRPKEDVFYKKVYFVCDKSDKPIATAFIWKANNEFNTIHWFKVTKKYEGKGIGRALMTELFKSLSAEDYPVYLHTQPGSFRAIKLYSDFGFSLITDSIVGLRKNDLNESLDFLKENMGALHFQALRKSAAPKYFLDRLKKFKTNDF